LVFKVSINRCVFFKALVIKWHIFFGRGFFENYRVGKDEGLDIGEQENYEEWSDYCHSKESTVNLIK
jgi:hypothetical protein